MPDAPMALKVLDVCMASPLVCDAPAAPAPSPSPPPPPLVQWMNQLAPNDGELRLLRHHPSGTGLQQHPGFAHHRSGCRSPRPGAGESGSARGAVPRGHVPHPAPGAAADVGCGGGYPLTAGISGEEVSSEQKRGATRGSLDFALGVCIKGRGAPRSTSLEGRVDVACGSGTALSARRAPGELGPGQEESPSCLPCLPFGSSLGWHSSSWWPRVPTDDGMVLLGGASAAGIRGDTAVGAAQLW